MGETKNHGWLKAAGKLIGAAAVFVGANFAGCVAAYCKNMEKIKEHENENNLMQTVSMPGKHVANIGPFTQNAYMTGITTSVTINVPRPVNEELYVEITGICAKVTVVIPKDVRVSYDGEEHLALFEDNLINGNSGEAPLVRIVRNNYLSKMVFVNAE